MIGKTLQVFVTIHRRKITMSKQQIWLSFGRFWRAIKRTLFFLGILYLALAMITVLLVKGFSNDKPVNEVKGPNPTSSPVSQSEKVYKSWVFGVSFVYPSNVIQDVQNSIYANTGETMGKHDPYQSVRLSLGDESVWIRFEDVHNLPAGFSPTERYKQTLEKDLAKEAFIVTDYKILDMDNYPVVYYTYAPRDEPEKMYYAHLRLKTQDNKYYIDISSNKPYEDASLLKLIVDSWYFTDPEHPSDVSRWKTLTLNSINFAVPTDWFLSSQIYDQKTYYYLSNNIPQEFRYDSTLVDHDPNEFSYFRIAGGSKGGMSLEQYVQTVMSESGAQIRTRRKLGGSNNDSITEFKSCRKDEGQAGQPYDVCRYIYVREFNDQVLSIAVQDYASQHVLKVLQTLNSAYLAN